MVELHGSGSGFWNSAKVIVGVTLYPPKILSPNQVN